MIAKPSSVSLRHKARLWSLIGSDCMATLGALKATNKENSMISQATPTPVDKYTALKNTLDWIENSSPEEFAEGFNSLTGDYNGVTIGEIIEFFETDE